MTQQGRQRRAEQTKAQTEKLLREALSRLLRGVPTHPQHVGRAILITPSSVCREARVSRQPLYTTHRALIEEIALVRQTVASRGRTGEQRQAQLKEKVATLEAQLKDALSENLTLVVRLHEANAGKIRELPAASRGHRPRR